MNIIKYINSKNKCHIFNLTNDKRIISELNLKNFSHSNEYQWPIDNIFPSKELLVFIISSNLVKDKSIFKMTNKHNNVVIFVIDDEYMQNNETQCINIFISHGYKCLSKTNSDKVSVFIYDIAEYKDKPDWLNNKNWANPELWEK